MDQLSPGPSSRQLKDEDFWGGLPRPLKAADKVTISVELVDFDKNEDQLAILSDHIVSAELRVEMLSLKQIQCSHLTIIPLNSHRFESLHQNLSDCSVV
jgi:hypothetical protein